MGSPGRMPTKNKDELPHWIDNLQVSTTLD